MFSPPPSQQAPLGYGDGGMSTTQELETCKRTVLSPYLYFLKLVSEMLGLASFPRPDVPSLVFEKSEKSFSNWLGNETSFGREA